MCRDNVTSSNIGHLFLFHVGEVWYFNLQVTERLGTLNKNLPAGPEKIYVCVCVCSNVLISLCRAARSGHLEVASRGACAPSPSHQLTDQPVSDKTYALFGCPLLRASSRVANITAAVPRPRDEHGDSYRSGTYPRSKGHQEQCGIYYLSGKFVSDCQLEKCKVFDS